MRALLRFRWVLPAIGIPVAVAVLGVTIQAAAFERPSRAVTLATNAIHQLAQYRVMRSSQAAPADPARSICLQGWFPRKHRVARGALVLLSDGTRLYDFGHGIRRFDGKAATWAQRRRFLLAGCPRLLGDRFATRLLRGAQARLLPTLADGTSVYAIRVAGSPLELFVARSTLRPVALRLTGAGTADLEPGGGRAPIAAVRRAFRLTKAKGRGRA